MSILYYLPILLVKMGCKNLIYKIFCILWGYDSKGNNCWIVQRKNWPLDEI